MRTATISVVVTENDNGTTGIRLECLNDEDQGWAIQTFLDAMLAAGAGDVPLLSLKVDDEEQL